MARPIWLRGFAALCLGFAAPAFAVPNDHLQCFKVRDRQTRTTYTADVAGLTVAPGCTIKVPAKLLCVEATKANVSPPPTGPAGTTAAGRFLCYKVKCPRGNPAPVFWTDQFGSRVVEPRNSKMLCVPGVLAPAGPVGTCSVSGVACQDSSDCTQTQLTGVCLANTSTALCVYDSFDPLGTQQSCQGKPAITESVGCASSIFNARDCPVGTACTGLGNTFCPESSVPIDYFCSARIACTSDADCTVSATDVCLFCGNGVKEGNENCDDGNVVDGDGCSVRCVGERTCVDGTHMDGPCATVADCPSICAPASCVCE